MYFSAKNFSLFCIFAVSLLASADAFTSSAITSSSPLNTLPVPQSTTALEAESSRRGVLGRLRGAVVGAATLSIFRPQIALAEHAPATTTGRIVELVVENVDGVEGKTGSIKLQLRPEWAPRGVQRFEVSTPKPWEGCAVYLK